MEMKLRTYSVLVVTASEKFRQTAVSLFSGSRCAPVRFAGGISQAKRAIAEQPFDFIIINAPFPDDAGIRFAIDVSDMKNTAELLLLPPDLYDSNSERAIEHGIFLLSKPVSKQTFLTALDWLASAREQLRKAEKKTVSIEEKMEEIRSVNRAKWLLIDQLKMTESDAHHYIEKQAMNRCISKAELAKEIILAYSK